MKTKLNHILNLIGTVEDGVHPTSIPFLWVIRRSHPTQHARAVLTPSFCLIVQGKKRIHLHDGPVEYGPGDFAASVIDMPTAGHVADATPENPYIGIKIEFTRQEIASIITEASVSVQPRDNELGPAAFVGKTTSEILDLIIRLLELLDKPKEVAFLSAVIKRELIFRFITGPYAHLFFRKMFFDQTSDGVGQAIEWIRANFSSPFKVEDLAKANGLSVSSFHHKFKSITAMGPLQYQKQLRLLEARRRMLSGTNDVATAALEVGYESPSQFNREYKRLFGQPPLKDIKALKKTADAKTFTDTQ